MGKFITSFENHNNYQQFNFNHTNTPNISLCKQEKEIHYQELIPKIPQLLDILYSDVNGNLSFTSEILPVSEGKTPIALCVAGTNFFGNNEPARWMSLKYMDCYNPEIGSLSSSYIYYGNRRTDISTIDNIQKSCNNNLEWGYVTVDYYDNSSQSNKLPSIFTENNTWNLSILGTVNSYAMTDINGKNKTNKILDTVTEQSTWQTDTSITNNENSGYAPAACCCARYHTLGTQAGDWYLGAAGEMCMILSLKTSINTKLTEINTIYPDNCISSLDNGYYDTSTEYSDIHAWRIRINNGYLEYHYKDSSNYLIAMLQY